MGDIFLGLIVLVVLDTLLFVGGRALAQRVSRRCANGLALLTFAALLVYTGCLWDQVAIFRLLPFSNMIVLGNWFPLAAGFLGGLASMSLAVARWRRWLSAAGLQGAAMIAVLAPLAGTAPKCANQWDSTGVCFQTTEQTCSAASAATLLKMHGIAATEQEMAELCLTRRGTHWMGLYRGLKKKTIGTPWDVDVFVCSATELEKLNQPVILSVGLSHEAKPDPVTQAEYGWTPGVRHSVVLLGFRSDQLVEIAEPTFGVGRERWSLEDLHQFFLGQGVRLIPREPHHSGK